MNEPDGEWRVAKFAVIGICVAVVNALTSFILLGFGHGSQYFVLLAGTPTPYGFVLPAVEGVIIGASRSIKTIVAVLILESAQVVAAFLTMHDRTDLYDAKIAAYKIPFASIPFICSYGGWKLIMIGVILSILTKRIGGSENKLPQ